MTTYSFLILETFIGLMMLDSKRASAPGVALISLIWPVAWMVLGYFGIKIFVLRIGPSRNPSVETLGVIVGSMLIYLVFLILIFA